MGFSSGTVSIGHSTKKSDYDRVLDNTKALKDEDITLNGVKTFTDRTVFNATATFNNPVVHNSGTTFNANATFNSALIFPAFGNVGTIIIAASTTWATSTEYLPGTTVAGNTLVVSNGTGTIIGSLSGFSNGEVSIRTGSEANLGLTGVWRLLCRVYRGTASGTIRPVGLLQRIS